MLFLLCKGLQSMYPLDLVDIESIKALNRFKLTQEKSNTWEASLFGPSKIGRDVKILKD